MKDASGVLIGVCRPVPGVLGFVTPVFRDSRGATVAQIVEEGRIVSFAQVELGEEFIALRSFASVSVGDQALYAMEFEDCIAVGPPLGVVPWGTGKVADWEDDNAIRTAFESNRYNKLNGFLTFPRSQSERRKLGVRLAACAAMLLLGVPSIYVVHDHLNGPEVSATGASLPNDRTLPDGTTLHIDGDSEVQIEYTDAARIVHVFAGTVTFDVAKNTQRPFIARTPSFDVTAVGTKFKVAIGDAITTTVSEGIVKVTPRGHEHSPGWFLKAGERVQLSGFPLTPPRIEAVEAGSELQEEDGWLVFEDLTLAQCVEELNRRNRVQIIIESPSLGAKVTSYARVKADTPEEYAAAAAATAGAKMTFDKERGVILISE